MRRSTLCLSCVILRRLSLSSWQARSAADRASSHLHVHMYAQRRTGKVADLFAKCEAQHVSVSHLDFKAQGGEALKQIRRSDTRNIKQTLFHRDLIWSRMCDYEYCISP